MTWKEKRRLKREGQMTVQGWVRLKYIAHLLPDRVLVTTDTFRGTMNKQRYLSAYGEWFVWFIRQRKTELEVVLHQSQ